ncbi:MAG: hypothetical protein KIS92_18775 [Planctomycetota bacterium]|nr:hypothetical protein [Planctomycetota bacterium]
MYLDEAIRAAIHGSTATELQVGPHHLVLKEALGVFDQDGRLRVHGRIVCPKEYPGEELAYMAVVEPSGTLISLEHKMEGSFPSPMPELLDRLDDYAGAAMHSAEVLRRIEALPLDDLGSAMARVILCIVRTICVATLPIPGA